MRTIFVFGPPTKKELDLVIHSHSLVCIFLNNRALDLKKKFFAQTLVMLKVKLCQNRFSGITLDAPPPSRAIIRVKLPQNRSSIRLFACFLITVPWIFKKFCSNISHGESKLFFTCGELLRAWLVTKEKKNIWISVIQHFLF